MTSPTPPSPSGPITKERALEIARKALTELKPGTEFVILEQETVEREFGWVFLYTTQKYLETKDRRFLVPGAGPMVVEREAGAIQYLRTSTDLDNAVDEFEKRWREGGAKPGGGARKKD